MLQLTSLYCCAFATLLCFHWLRAVPFNRRKGVKPKTRRATTIRIPAHLRPADVSHVPVESNDWNDKQFYIARHEPFDLSWADSGQPANTSLALLKHRWLEHQRTKWGAVVARFGGQV